MSDPTGRAAIVTGAGSGIGRAIALRLLDEGGRVVIADVNEPAAAE
ncbi:MAG: SDR family NAD(P)-dependent oxidoreductase, partial [Thermoleophilaceae bacterium]